MAKAYNYKDNYIAVNEHIGSDLRPVFNNLVLVSEMRSYEIQQVDYGDRFRVFNALGDQLLSFGELARYIKEIEDIKWFEDKMKYVYNLNLFPEQIKLILDNVSNTDLSKYYYSISSSRAGTLGYKKFALEKEYIAQKTSIKTVPQIENDILSTFQIGGKYSNVMIKDELKKIYNSCIFILK